MEAAVPPRPPRSDDCPGDLFLTVQRDVVSLVFLPWIGHPPWSFLYQAGSGSPAASAGACKHIFVISGSSALTTRAGVVIYGL